MTKEIRLLALLFAVAVAALLIAWFNPASLSLGWRLVVSGGFTTPFAWTMLRINYKFDFGIADSSVPMAALSVIAPVTAIIGLIKVL